MVRSTIKLSYQTMFNYFVQKDGYTRLTHYLASFYILITFIFLIGDLFHIANLIHPSLIGFSAPKKSVSFLMIIIISLLNYLLFFQILKLEKEGEPHDHLFIIYKVQYKRTLKAIIAIAISFFVLTGLVILRQFLEELN
jgi:hypothetical protein